MHLQHTKIQKSWKKEKRLPMIELNNAGEFRVGDDGTENITVIRDYIDGFPDLVQDEENIETNSGNLWKINNLTSIIYIVSRLSYFTGQE